MYIIIVLKLGAIPAFSWYCTHASSYIDILYEGHTVGHNYCYSYCLIAFIGQTIILDVVLIY